MINLSYTILLLLLSLHSKVTQCSTTHLKLQEFQTKLQTLTSPSTYTTPPLPTSTKKSEQSSGRVFYPIGYGADPTGAHDSSAAILAAVADAAKLQNGVNLMPGISDLGGAVIDLQGGSFLVNTPIRFPPAIGNIVVQDGTIRASTTFPGDRHLIELWAPDSPNGVFSNAKDSNNGLKYEDITLKDLLLDSNYRGGGLLVIDSARVRITNCFFLHFTTQGILVLRGHETFLRSCFLGQHPTVGGDRDEKAYSGTAIDIASTDNAITDVAIFSAAIGIVLRGRANIVTGVHCYNKATYFGGVGILVKSAQNRIIDPYLDYNSIVVEDPFQITISNGFFLGDGNIVLKAIQGSISGLNIVNNVFSGDPKNMVPSVRLDGVFTSIDQVEVDHNAVSGMGLKSTKGKMAVQGNGTKWEANFDPILLFPNKINHVHYSLYLTGGIGGGFPTHAVTNVSNNVVVIESQQAVNAVVSVYVDQDNMVGEGSL
ncbi:hypothetical protein SASPL_142027 [Salvia splendens]|uniref:Polygalacturonase n=1 Tax=Salvia splendens TaxID=180675 RepID=A0A8X8Z9F4_SALSN|nr:polygalacturonase QRT3 isoform X1 [Salvia splendens]KAG6395894.1 hypothetical protein SASPL_142027 [Salvia splendens]